MKQYIHEYKGYGRVPSKCKVYIIECMDGLWMVGFEDLDTGTSVTNASEQLATEIIKKEKLNPEDTTFYEWYPYYEGEVSQIMYNWNNGVASNPSWKYFCSSENNSFLKQ